jgi:cytosine/adenosine deaminase-related metal-dependent hydrolase
VNEGTHKLCKTEIPFGVDKDGLLALSRYADEHGMLITMHVNENADDGRAILADCGQYGRFLPLARRTRLPWNDRTGTWGNRTDVK